MFLALALRLWRAEGEAEQIRVAKRLFAYSILYLFGLFAVLLVERVAAGLTG
jgi:protoheme IX farnesyltransferase